MSHSRSSNAIAVLALLSLLPIFLWVVGDGWYGILKPYLEDNVPNAVIWATGFAVAFVAVILAWAVASERARLKVDNFAKTTWVAYLGVLFTLSAVGTINFLFLKFEAATFIKEMARTTETQLAELDRVIRSDITLPATENLKQAQDVEKIKLKTLQVRLKGAIESSKTGKESEQQQVRNRIDKLFDDFETEVRNPLRSGCGEVAQGYLSEIRKLLPELQLPSGSCQQANADLMLKTYKTAIQKATDRRLTDGGSFCANSQEVRNIASDIEAIIKIPPTALSGPCPNAETALKETEKAIANYLGSLPTYAPGEQARFELRDKSSNSLQKQLQIIDEFLIKPSPDKDTAAEKLKPAWNEYRLVYSNIKGAVNNEKLRALPPIIDDPQLDRIGNFINTLEILISRYNHITTYPIILAGLLLDLILISFFSRIEAARYQRRPRSAHEERLRNIHSSIDDD